MLEGCRSKEKGALSGAQGPLCRFRRSLNLLEDVRVGTGAKRAGSHRQPTTTECVTIPVRLERKLQVPVVQKDERFYFLPKSQEGPVNIPLGTCSMLALGLYKNVLDYEILHAACTAEFWLRTN